MARGSSSRRYRPRRQIATGEPGEWLPPDPDCAWKMHLVDQLSPDWRAVVKAVGLKKALDKMEDGRTPAQALRDLRKHII